MTLKNFFNDINIKWIVKNIISKLKIKFRKKDKSKLKNKYNQLIFNSRRLNKRYFFTYGDHRFIKSRERIVTEANQTGLFDECFFYSNLLLPDDDFNKLKQENKQFSRIASSKRGGGYWLWKPFILYKSLLLIEEGDTIIYSDAGSTIIDSNKFPIDKFENLILEVENSKEGVLGCRNPYIEKDWTKGDVFEYFNVYSDINFTHSRQFSSGRLHIARKCERSLKIYLDWWLTATKRPDLFDDSPSMKPNLSGFKENRHDQSVWSLICKKHGVVDKKDWDLIPIDPSRIRE